MLVSSRRQPRIPLAPQLVTVWLQLCSAYGATRPIFLITDPLHASLWGGYALGLTWPDVGLIRKNRLLHVQVGD